MYNGYNETPLISYNEFNQDKVEKKLANVPKWSYGHDAGVQLAQNHSNNRNSEIWSGKSSFLGATNVVKCNCTGCYPSSENQSYQGDTNRHRSWLPRTFPVPLNDPSESCKLPAYQWDNGLSNQSSCYMESNLPYTQENGGKYQYYRHYQQSQCGVITSIKNAEYVKKSKNDMSSRALESPLQNGTRQPVFCSPAYDLTKRADGRSYCDLNDKYSNVTSFSVDQHIPRLPVVEPFIKAVPSNLSQNRVPSVGYRSVKENIPQSYIDSGFGDARKICAETAINSDKRNEAFSTGQLQSGIHIDHSNLKLDLPEGETQKIVFNNTRHPDYYSRSSIQDVIKRNNLDYRKDYMINQISQMSIPEQHYNLSRSKYQEEGNSKSSYEAFYSEEFQKVRPENRLLENSSCYQRIDDTKTENTNFHARLPRSALIFNDPHFDKTQNSVSGQSDPVSYRNNLRPECSYQNFNTQVRFECSAGFRRNDLNQYRVTTQQIQNSEHFTTQQGSNFIDNLHCQQNSDKAQHLCGEKNQLPFQADFQAVENKKTSYLEAVRSDEISKNGTNKISPLRLLRKKKFINVPQESTAASTLDSAPGLDVRKFWSTWAEEEEENLISSQMIVLDCQNIDPEQAKLLNLYETDPVRAVQFESGSIVIKGSNCTKDSTSQAVQFEEIKTYEELMANEPKIGERTNSETEKSATKCNVMQQKETEKAEKNNSALISESENKSAVVESACHIKPPPKSFKKVRSEQEDRGKTKSEIIDKWTEKKFDFLKRAEESKAAEILRHEEEKKKILETRQSIQQSWKKAEKCQEKNISGLDEGAPERICFENFENLQSNFSQTENSDTFNLPTSEYRRNKFLDYSDRKIIFSGTEKIERNTEIENANPNPYIINESNEEEIKKEENVKLDCSNSRPDKHPTETVFSLLNPKLKEEEGVKVNDTLRKDYDINFPSSEIKFENESENCIAKKSRALLKKLKKKKSDLQTEDDERKDKLTVETVSKPTIKFSIQKSHDLKISFKVLNNSKECSEESTKGDDKETKGNSIEDSKNSTELITLKYKSIQRRGERGQNSDVLRNRRGFRKKKKSPEMKTPVLKIKKSRYMLEKEKDPLAVDECLGDLKKHCLNECATSDDFQVQETVDSAKIKLTFKRHKGSFEKEYKANSSDIDKISVQELEPIHEEYNKYLEIAKSKVSRKAKKQELFVKPGIEYFKNNSGPSSDGESGWESPEPQLKSALEENSKNSSTSPDSNTEKENCDLKSEVPIFTKFPPQMQFPLTSFENSPLDYDKFMLSEGRKNHDTIENFKLNGETEKFDQDRVEFTIGQAISCDENNESENNRDKSSLLNCSVPPYVNLKELAPGKSLSLEKNQNERKDLKKEKFHEISIDFMKSTKSLKTETNHVSGESLETEILLNVKSNTEAVKEKSCPLENSSGIEHFESLKSSYESKIKKDEDYEKTFPSENLKMSENLLDWKGDPLDIDDDDNEANDSDNDKPNVNFFDNFKNQNNDLEKTSDSLLSLTELENENFRKTSAPSEKPEGIINGKKTNDVLLGKPSLPGKSTELYPIDECLANLKENYENKNLFQPELDKSTKYDLEGLHLKSSVKDFVENDIAHDISSFKKSKISILEMSPKGTRTPPVEFKNFSKGAEKLNKNTDDFRKSPKPEISNPSNFELSLEVPGENIFENDLEYSHSSSQTVPEATERVFDKTQSKIWESEACCLIENSTSEISKFLNNSVKECYKVNFSPPTQTDAKNSDITFEKAKLSSVSTNNTNGRPHLKFDAKENKKVSQLDYFIFPTLRKTQSSETILKDTNSLSIDNVEFENLTNKEADDNHDSDSPQRVRNMSEFQIIIKNNEKLCEKLQNSPKASDLELLSKKLLRNNSDFTTVSGNSQNRTISSTNQNFINDITLDVSLLSDVELEEGEIIDSSDELHEGSSDGKQILNVIQPFKKFTKSNKTQGKQVDFVNKKIKRRHSTKMETLSPKKESQNAKPEIWSKREFPKAKSCPPEIKFPTSLLVKAEETLNILVENIPLPLGPPPYSSCLNMKKYLSFRIQAELPYSEAKDLLKKSTHSERPCVSQKGIPLRDSQFRLNDFQNRLSPPVLEKDTSVQLDIFQRSSKIKFSFSKRSKFSKIDLKNATGKNSKDLQFKVFSGGALSKSKIEEEFEKNEDFKDDKIRIQDISDDQNSAPKECQIEEVPNMIFANKTEEAQNLKEIGKSLNDLEQPVALLCENLEENIEVINAMNDFIRDELYECEDIPTSEDLTNGGDDLENEKVNDDKFRNIMQNCLDNAKKFLNVGNLKLFSCSVDDLLELDCQNSESALGENEHEKTTNHISRDVLLTSCEDTSDDLGLSENVLPADISMDFVPSFCSDVCSEILPVDNWPYLEEEVPSSPTKLKQDETDLIPSLENASLNKSSESCLQFCPKNGIERLESKRVIRENNFKSFRRKSFVSNEQSLKMCSKIDCQRRKTVESLTGGSCGRNICDIKTELIKLNNRTNEKEKSLKCRLSLEKLTNKHEINFELKNERMKPENKMKGKNVKNLNYKSPRWQPRVMLFRISKNDLRKMMKSSKTCNLSESKNSDYSPKKKSSSDRDNDVLFANKKQKFISESGHEERKIDRENPSGEKFNLPRLDSIKGSLTAITSTISDVKRSKKCRFRNLHSKKKIAPVISKDEKSLAQNTPFMEPTLVHEETILIEMFKDCNRSSNSLIKNTKEVISSKDGDEKLKRNLSEIKLGATENHRNASSQSVERLEKNRIGMSHFHNKSKEHLKEDERGSEKSHNHRESSREKKEGKEHRKEKERDREDESKKYSRHDRSRHLRRSSIMKSKLERSKRERCRSPSGGDEKKWKSQIEISPEGRWTCEVCGFDDSNERVVHIKSHPFHCQSCHLAFRTETHFINHLTKKHKDIRNQHHCLLCELSFDTEEQYRRHLETREHRHLESVEKNTINTLFTLLTGAPCPVLGLVEMRPEWLPNQAGTVHFYHQATPLSLALQFLNDCTMGPELRLTFLQIDC